MTAQTIGIRQQGNMLVATHADGSQSLYAPTVGGSFIPLVADAVLPDNTVHPPLPNPTDTTVQQSLKTWLLSKVGVYYYTQLASKRLQPDVSGGTDCSGLMRYMYHQVANIEIGTWTGDQQNYGLTVLETTADSVDESRLVIGDLVFYDWGSYTYSFDHVEMYIGGGQTCGHGGPGNGPTVKSLQNNVAYASRVRVRRYV